ncbi:MAG: hypothetical protein GX957_07940 [Clostridiaceae bacterium]|nr:hypothetical protein [Clostridiaceae bacterium]
MSCDKKETSCRCDSVIHQLIDLDITQNQAVSQENENVQLAAIAVALGGGLAKASQKSCQLNDNSQIVEGIAKNNVDFDSENNKLSNNSIITADVQFEATGNLTYEQSVEQENENIQLITLAVADNSRSTAIADDINSQENVCAQTRSVLATNTVDADNQVNTLEDKQVKKQVNPASIGSGEVELHKLRLSEQSFAVKVAFNYDGSIMEIVANDQGEVKVDEIKSSDVSAEADAVKSSNTVLVALDLAGDHLEISADQDGNVFVNGEKV